MQLFCAEAVLNTLQAIHQISDVLVNHQRTAYILGVDLQPKRHELVQWRQISYQYPDTWASLREIATHYYTLTGNAGILAFF